MMLTLTAVYENGVLRPLTPLNLREHTQVEVQVSVLTSPQTATRDEVVQALLATGQVSHWAREAEPNAPEAARQTPPTLPGPSASEIILEQRRGTGL